MFGDSLTYGGLAIVALLGQSRHFYLSDFSYHLAKVHAVDQKKPEAGAHPSKDVPRMVAKIRKIQILNDQIFTQFDKYLNKPDRKFSHLYNAKVVHFDPPKSKLTSLTSSAGADGLQLDGGNVAEIEA